MNFKFKLSYKSYYYLVLFIAFIGLINSIYLGWLHFQNYTDINFSSFCAISQKFNCDTVSQSPWSILFDIPVAYWGFLGYLFYLSFLVQVYKHNSDRFYLWYILFSLSLIYAIAACFFGYISAIIISSHCIMCLLNHIVCLSLFFLNLLIINRFCNLSYIIGIKYSIFYIRKSIFLKTSITSVFVLLIIIKMSLPHYWLFTPPSLSSSVENSGLTDEGNPWIGYNNAKIIIHEYADYLCFQCSKMHLMLRHIISANPNSIKLIHHHYPLDHEYNNIVVPEPFHVGSGKMAMIAIYAASKNKFWQMNDALYAAGRSKKQLRLKILAEQTGFTVNELAAAAEHPQIREALLYDIRKGMKLHITGTPSYVIDDVVYTGNIPGTILKSIMQ